MSDTPFIPSVTDEPSNRASHSTIDKQPYDEREDLVEWRRTKSGYQYPVSIYDDKRIAKLRQLSLFNLSEEPTFLRITELAKNLFDVPFVTLAFLDEHVQYLQAGQGLGDLCLIDRQDAICNFTLVSNDAFVILDLTADDNFALNPLVSDAPHLRFYAGVPVWLHSLSGEYAKISRFEQAFLPMRVATLCLLDTKAHQAFDEADKRLLTELGGLVSDALMLKQQQAIAKQANQIKSQFLANISHEIRTPMNGVMGMVEMLQETSLSQEQQHYSHHIYQSCQHLLAIVNDILDLSKVEAGAIDINPTIQSLSEMLEEVTALYQPQANNKQLTLQTALADQRYSQADESLAVGVLSDCVLVDKVRLKQVLCNLVNNAMKFTPTQGTVSLQLALTDMHTLPEFDYPEQWINSSQDISQLTEIQAGSHRPYRSDVPVTSLPDQAVNQLSRARLHIQVCDTGIGIKPESLQVIFDAYNQADKDTHRFYGGTGLGLSVTKALVKAMNGNIEARSVVELGTVFYVSLPVVLVRPSEVSQVVQWLDKIGTSSKRFVNQQSDLLYQYGMSANELLDMVAQGTDTQLTNAGSLMNAKDDNNKNYDAKADNTKDDQVVHDSTLLTVPNTPSQHSSLSSNPSVTLPPVIEPSDVLPNSLPDVMTKTSEHVYRSVSNHKNPNFNRVLLVEDNAVNATIATSILTKAGYQVIHVTDGEHALMAYQRHAEHIVLILMDDRLPTISGIETTRQLIDTYGKANLPPIIAVTANTLGEGDTRYQDAGMQDYLAKPFSKERLQKMMQKWLGAS